MTPEYTFKRGRAIIRISVSSHINLPPYQTSSESSADAPDTPHPHRVNAISKVHLSGPDPESTEMTKLVQWTYSLNPNEQDADELLKV